MSIELSAPSSANQSFPPVKLWGQAQRELIFIHMAVMEIALITPIAMALMRWTGFWPPIQVAVWLCCLLLLSFNLVRLMSLLWIKAEIQRNVLVAGFFILVMVAFPLILYQQGSVFNLRWMAAFYENLAWEGNQLWARDLSLFLLMLLAWWRGIRLAGQSLSVQRAGLRLRVGGLIIAPMAIWSARRLAWDVTPFVALFFFTGLTAVALARAEQNERERSGLSALQSPRWLTSMVAYSAVTVWLSATSAAFVSGDSALAVVRWLSPLRTAISVGAAAVFSTVVYLSRPLFTLFSIFLEWLSRLLRSVFARVLSEGFDLPEFGPAIELTPEEAAERAAPLFEGDKAIALLLMIALVLVVSLTMRRLFRQRPLADEQVQPLSADDVARQKRRTPIGRRLLERIGLLRRWRAAASIRRVYQQMSRAAEASGYPRARSETPYEYLEMLGRAWPNNRADTRQITQAYVQVRYGEIPETREELAEILDAWERLSQTPSA